MSCFSFCSKPAKNPLVQQKKSEPPARLTIPPPPSIYLRPQPKIEEVPKLIKKEPIKDVPAYRLITNVDKSNVKFSEERPDIPKRKLFPYYCPLCFRYFNSMLICFRCKNYICRFCADEIGERSVEAVRCAFCDCAPFVLLDVNEKDPIKKYSDTSYLTGITGFKCTKKPGITIKQQNAAQKENVEQQETPKFKAMQSNSNNTGIDKQRRIGRYLEEIKENNNLADWSPAYDLSKGKLEVKDKETNNSLDEGSIRSAVDIAKGTFQSLNLYEDIENSEVSIASV